MFVVSAELHIFEEYQLFKGNLNVYGTPQFAAYQWTKWFKERDKRLSCWYQIPWQQSKPIAFSIPNGHKYRTGDPNSWVQNCSCVLTIYFATVSCGFSQSKAAIASNLRAASFTKKHARTINFLYVLQKKKIPLTNSKVFPQEREENPKKKKVSKIFHQYFEPLCFRVSHFPNFDLTYYVTLMGFKFRCLKFGSYIRGAYQGCSEGTSGVAFKVLIINCQIYFINLFIFNCLTLKIKLFIFKLFDVKFLFSENHVFRKQNRTACLWSYIGASVVSDFKLTRENDDPFFEI